MFSHAVSKTWPSGLCYKEGLGFCLPSPSGHVFHTAWETMIKCYTNIVFTFLSNRNKCWNWMRTPSLSDGYVRKGVINKMRSKKSQSIVAMATYVTTRHRCHVTLLWWRHWLLSYSSGFRDCCKRGYITHIKKRVFALHHLSSSWIRQDCL